MFDQLPETNPSKNKKRPRAFLAAALIQLALVAAVIVIQMAMPERLGEFQLLTTLYMAPPPSPPAPALGLPHEAERKPEKRVETASAEVRAIIPQQPVKPAVEQPELSMPTVIPKEIAKIPELGPGAGGVIGGIPGGVPAGTGVGTPGGIFGGVLGGAASTMPPPPPPQAPIRVGGDVKAPKLLKIVEPHYPPEAKRARVEGVVVLEATVTEAGTVNQVKIISGNPLLVNAAIEAVQQWKYEPTILNGKPVAVILTAKVTFQLSK